MVHEAGIHTVGKPTQPQPHSRPWIERLKRKNQKAAGVAAGAMLMPEPLALTAAAAAANDGSDDRVER